MNHESNAEKPVEGLIEEIKNNCYDTVLFQAFYKKIESSNPIDTIEILNYLYKIEQKEAVIFLLQQLAKFNPSKVELYYKNLARKMNICLPRDPSRDLCILERYEEAVEFIEIEVASVYIDLVLACIVSRNKELLQQADRVLPKEYKNVLQKCLGLEIELIAQEIDLYNLVIEYVQRLGIKY